MSDLYEGARELNQAGYNIYMVAQPTDGISKGGFAEDQHVVGVRGLFADCDDDRPLPTDWHAPPTFTAEHPTTGRKWYFWRTGPDWLAPSQIRDLQTRIFHHYGTDSIVINEARIVRLVGFDRWKQEKGEVARNWGPYHLSEHNTGAPEYADLAKHLALPQPPGPALPAKPQDDASQGWTSFDRLKRLLAYVEPLRRDDWLRVSFAMREADIREQGIPVEDDARLALFDDWASGELWEQAPPDQRLPDSGAGEYQDWNESAEYWNGKRGKPAKPVTIRTIYYLARRHARDQGIELPSNLHPSYAEKAGLTPIQVSRDTEAQATVMHRYRRGQNPYGSRRWLAFETLPECGVAFLAGQYSAGKTFVAMDLVTSVGTGTPFVGIDIDRPGGTLWFAAEGADEVPVRLDGMMQARGLAGEPPLIWVDEVPLILCKDGPAEIMAHCKEAAAQFANEGLPLAMIVVDTVMSSAGWTDGNSSAEAQQFIFHWRRIARELGVLVLLVDHHGKNADAGIHGSVAKAAGGDAILNVLAIRHINKHTKEIGPITGRLLEIHKVRGGKADREVPFTLAQVKLGQDDRGRDVTTCTVEWKQSVAAPGRDKVHQRSGPPANDDRQALPEDETSPSDTNFLVEAIARVLDRNPQLELTDRGLAELLTCEDNIKWGADHIRKKLLPPLREGATKHPLLAGNYAFRGEKTGRWKGMRPGERDGRRKKLANSKASMFTPVPGKVETHARRIAG